MTILLSDFITLTRRNSDGSTIIYTTPLSALVSMFSQPTPTPILTFVSGNQIQLADNQNADVNPVSIG